MQASAPGKRRAKRSAAPPLPSAPDVAALLAALPALRAEVTALVDRAELLLGTCDEIDRLLANAEHRGRRFNVDGGYE